MLKIRILAFFMVLFLVIPIVANGCVVVQPLEPDKPSLEDFYDGEYDNSSFLVKQEDLNRLVELTTPVEVKFEKEFIHFFLFFFVRREGIAFSQGVGTFFGNYILTVAHLFPEEYLEVYTKQNGEKVELDLLYINQSRDQALLKMPDSKSSSFTEKFGDPEDLNYGDWLYIVSQFENQINLKSGMVSSPDPVVVPELKERNLECEDFIYISADVVGGDSGSPVFALRDGTPELVGILAYAFKNPRREKVTAAVIRIDTIEKDLLEAGYNLRLNEK